MTLPTPDPAFRWTREAWGPALRCRPLESAAQHLFTSRQLELRPLPAPASQLARSDEGWDIPANRRGPPTHVTAEGWIAAAVSAGSSVDRLIRVTQVHGHAVRVLRRGAVSNDAALERPDGDAVLANEPGLVLAVTVADCVPILFADRESGAAAAVHAGWRGTCARVARASVQSLVREFGARPENILAAIGPSIGPADYEVGESLIEAFLQAGHARGDVDRWFTRDGEKPHLDLWSANRDQLIAADVRPDHIFTCGLSTLAHPDVFHSYRAQGPRAGRMAALIVVPGA